MALEEWAVPFSGWEIASIGYTTNQVPSNVHFFAVALQMQLTTQPHYSTSF
jgi:hypothetical protein